MCAQDGEHLGDHVSAGIFGIGVDTVDIARFEGQLSRTPKLRERLFTPTERELAVHSLAARFAAKEALIKALRGSHELGWQDLEVTRLPGEAPQFTLTERLARECRVLGAGRIHLSMTHDGGSATAFVVVETPPETAKLRNHSDEGAEQ